MSYSLGHNSLKIPERVIALAAFALCLLATPILADDAVTLNNPSVTPGETAAQCYHDAMQHLEHGVWYERAAVQLKEAIRQDPKNADYHLALGCAYADRAASIGYAEGFALKYTADLAKYLKDLADWEKAQQDPKSDDYGDPRPTPPPKFSAYTKDDLKAISMTRKYAEARIAVLGKLATDEWANAISLTKTLAERAHAEYVQGWGIYLLSWYADYDFFIYDTDDDGNYKKDASAHIEVDSMPGSDEAVDALKKAAKDDPANAVYWQSLGDIEPAGESGSAESGPLKDYREALKLNPKNCLLWLQLACLENSDPKQATEDMRQAVKADPRNAFLMYLIACREMEQSRFNDKWRNSTDVADKIFALETTDPDARAKAAQAIRNQAIQDLSKAITPDDRKLSDDAVNLVEQGNETPFCSYPRYLPNMPDLLAPALAYQGTGGGFVFGALSQIRNLARDLSGAADVDALQGDLPEAIRLNRLAIGMGEKLVGDWPLVEQDRKDSRVLLAMVGMGTSAIGYRSLVQLLQAAGDPESLQSAQGEFDAFKKQITDWGKEREALYPFESEEYAQY